MLKNFSFLFLFFLSFSVYSMQNDGPENQSKNSKYKLFCVDDKTPPTKEDIQSYEEAYGTLPEILEKFYTTYGNCTHSSLDLLHIHKGKNSDLGKATEFIRKYLDNYHAIAFDQGAGGYWVYTTSTYPTLEIFNTDRTTLTGESIGGLNKLLLK